MSSNIQTLKREITTMRESLERKNRQLDAMGRVWCDGGCGGGMHRYSDEEVTADDVAFLVHNACRARAWFINRAGREDKTGTVEPREPLWEKARVELREAEGNHIRRTILEAARDAMCPDGCGKGSKERPLRLPEDGFHYPSLRCTATPIRFMLKALDGE